MIFLSLFIVQINTNSKVTIPTEHASQAPIAVEISKPMFISISTNGSASHVCTFKPSFRIPACLKHFTIGVDLTSFHAIATHRIATKTLIELVTSLALLHESIFDMT